MDVMIFNFHMEGKQCHGDLVLPIANFHICCIKFLPLSNEALLCPVPAGAMPLPFEITSFAGSLV